MENEANSRAQKEGVVKSGPLTLYPTLENFFSSIKLWHARRGERFDACEKRKKRAAFF